VAELTHDPEDGFHEIQLSGKQLVFLFMATTVISVVIFLCGVLVGRSVGPESAADQPIDSSAANAAPTPTGTEPAAGQPSEPPAPVPETELTYHERLLQNKPGEEPKKRAESAAPPKPDAPVTTQQKPETPRAVAPPQTVKPAAKPTPTAGDVPTSGRPGTWVIQVQALQNRAAAGAIVKRLIAKGYPAFVPQPAAGGPVMYRVQIGRFSDRAEAERVARRLEKEEQFKPDIKR
jgi:cell division septation protein DedD